MLRLAFAFGIILSLALPLSADQPDAAGLQFFEAKIRPVLVRQCYQCHSQQAADDGKLQGELLLDTRAGTLRGGESGPAVVPGDTKASLLMAAVRHETFQMPPDTKLKASVIGDFAKWIEMGAPDPRDGETVEPQKGEIDIAAGRQFWSFQPLQSATPPQVTHEAWIRNDIDRFILARLEANGLQPNAEADRQTLIRRLYYDAWGLPPTPDEVDAFLNDKADNAYEQLVDRLLEGEHFGERWARHWLDLARFAESNGYAFDKDRAAAFHYRDFVIRAFNEDLPYDRFVALQVAGDQIAPDDYMAQAATGFLAAGPFTSQQTQKERERSRYEQLDDIVGTMGTALLGLTVGCARCHDHKFDPLPTHDYYRFTACFAETGFQDFDYDPDPEGTRVAKAAFDKTHQPLVQARVRYEKEQLPAKLTAWQASQSEPPPRETLSVWHTMGPFSAANFKAAYNGRFAPEKEIHLDKMYDGLTWTPQPDWRDGQVHNTLRGDNSANYLHRTIDVAQAGPLPISLGRDDAIKVWLNGKQVLAKEVTGGAAADQDQVTLQLKAGRNDLLIKIVNASGPSGFYFSTKPTIPANIAAILKIASEKRNPKQQAALLKWFAPRDPGWAELNRVEQEHLQKAPKPDITKIFAARRNGATYNFGPDTRKVYFLARGNANAKRGQASPGFLQVLTDAAAPTERWWQEGEHAASPDKRPPRVALADWLTDPDSGAGHLLARVIVNRLWQHHMGRGIVATPSDFGSQGMRPTHPGLLDYLAGELVQSGWRLKAIHKQIMMSAVYRQSVAVDADAARLDPDNQWYARRAAQRLDAEVIRDALLAVSGTLDRTMYGKGSLDQANPRRSVYLTVKRSNLIPILQLFDAPDAMQGLGQRSMTTVPPQALAMMNSAFVRQIAEQFADRVQSEIGRDPQRVIDAAYRMALSRPPAEEERERMLAFIDSQTNSYGNGDKANDRALVDYCQLMLCLNEFVFID